MFKPSLLQISDSVIMSEVAEVNSLLPVKAFSIRKGLELIINSYQVIKSVGSQGDDGEGIYRRIPIWHTLLKDLDSHIPGNFGTWDDKFKEVAVARFCFCLHDFI